MSCCILQRCKDKESLENTFFCEPIFLQRYSFCPIIVRKLMQKKTLLPLSNSFQHRKHPKTRRLMAASILPP